MAETIQIWGQTPGGLSACVTVDLNQTDAEGNVASAFDNEDFIVGLEQAINNWGITPPAAAVAAAPAPAPAPAPRSAQPQRPGPSAAATGGAGCPIHGTEFAKAGFRNQGYECKFRQQEPAPWAKDKPWQDNDGNVWYYCKSKWN